MTAIAERQREYTPEDLLTMPGGEHCELVDGVLVEKDMGAEADWIATRIIARLVHLCETTGIGDPFGGECGYQCFPDAPRKVRKPDVSFVAAGRLPGNRPPKGHIQLAPDLAVEVVSPNDLYSEVRLKVQEYRDAGVRLIWVVDPESRTVEVIHPDGSGVTLTEQAELAGDDILPGFRCRVADLLPPREEAAETE
jgi:Uma2 family endonuclease